MKNYFSSYKAERANKFIAYFQNFTNTYAPVEILKEKENMFHPTAGDLVKLVLDAYPSIGQATIYRNVNKLVEEATPRSVTATFGQEVIKKTAANIKD